MARWQMPRWNLRRSLRARLPAGLRRVFRIRVAAGLKRALLVAAAFAVVAVLTVGGLPVLRRLYVIGWLAREHYQIAFAALCIVPAATVHLGAARSGLRGTAWWIVWLPGIVVYAAFPWRRTVSWEALGIFGHAWDWARTIFLHWNTAPPEVFNNFGAFVTMLAATIVAVGKLWVGAGKAVGRLGPETAAAPEDVLPSATWASRSEVVERFSVPGGIVLGELTDPLTDSPRFAPGSPETWGGQGDGQLITMSPTDGNGHVLVTSQASGYKSTGLVIPNILNYRKGPVVVFDPKCELFARTRKAREAMEYEPVVIDETNGFDPARLIAMLAVDHPSAYRRMARMMIPKGYSGVENGQFFKEAAISLFTALLGFYGERGSPHIIQDIAKLVARPPDKVFEEINEKLGKSKLPFVRNHLAELEGMDERFWGSIKTEITNNLMFSEMPDIERYVTMDPKSPLPAQILDPKCDIFLNIPQNVAEDFAPMLRLMLGSMLTAAEFLEVNEDPSCRRLFLIDEAAKLGSMDILENIRDRGRSRGLHLMLFYQTPGEIERIWGRPGMTSWRDGCSATIMGPVSSRASATEISAMIGRRHVRVRTGSTSSSTQVMSVMSGSVSSSEQEQLRDVDVISPTEISQLPTHASIITATGRKPILASKAIWFTRKDMQGRVRSTEEIKPELAVTRSQAKVKKRMAQLLQPAVASAAAAQDPAAAKPDGDGTGTEAAPREGPACDPGSLDPEPANGTESETVSGPADTQGEAAPSRETEPEENGQVSGAPPEEEADDTDEAPEAETAADPATTESAAAKPGAIRAGASDEDADASPARQEPAAQKPEGQESGEEAVPRDGLAGEPETPEAESAKGTESGPDSEPAGTQGEVAASTAPSVETEEAAAGQGGAAAEGSEAAPSRETEPEGDGQASEAPPEERADDTGMSREAEMAKPPASPEGTDANTRPADAGAEWTKADAERFVRLVQEEMSLPEIAADLGKSHAEVEAWSKDQLARALVPEKARTPDGGPGARKPEGDGPGGPAA